jgi:hypothetical protein
MTGFQRRLSRFIASPAAETPTPGRMMGNVSGTEADATVNVTFTIPPVPDGERLPPDPSGPRAGFAAGPPDSSVAGSAGAAPIGGPSLASTGRRLGPIARNRPGRLRAGRRNV